MNDKNNIEEILLRSFTGSASKEELEFLKKWQESSKENNREYEKYRRTWQLWENYALLSRIDTDKALNKVEKNISKSRQPSLFKIYRLAAVILFPILLIGNLLLVNNNSTIKPETVPSYKVVSAYGTRTQVVLPDSSTVWLNAGSSLSYPVVFNKEKREVELTGEGYFDIEKNKNAPFYVRLDNIYVKVLGTTFNVKMYPDEDRIETTLLTGEVTIVKKKGNKEIQMVKMQPDQYLVYDKKDNKISLETMDSDDAVNADDLSKTNNISLKEAKALVNKHSSWIGGKLIFRNDPMEEVVRKLERWYNVSIEIADDKIKQYNYTATFTDETLEQTLNFLTLSAPIKYKIINEKIVEPNNYCKKKVLIYSNSTIN